MNKLDQATNEFINKDVPEFSSGDTVSVEVKVREGSKERLQKYEGVVIARHGKKGVDASFTVRKISNGIGVERIFPLHSPMLSLIEVKRRGKVRRAKLNYLKNITGLKAARIEEKR
jgi:large subunit ribosomal protein L19